MIKCLKSIFNENKKKALKNLDSVLYIARNNYQHIHHDVSWQSEMII